MLLFVLAEARFQFERMYKIPSMYNRFKSFTKNELILDKNCGSHKLGKEIDFLSFKFFKLLDDSMFAQRIVDVICKDFDAKDHNHADRLKGLPDS